MQEAEKPYMIHSGPSFTTPHPRALYETALQLAAIKAREILEAKNTQLWLSIDNPFIKFYTLIGRT